MGNFNRCTRQPAPTSELFSTTMLLLTDGRILCNSAYTARWWMIIPGFSAGRILSETSVYINAFFREIPGSPSGITHRAAVVLPSGHALGLTFEGLDVFDPLTLTWSEVSSPDMLYLEPPLVSLPDGRVMVHARRLSEELTRSYTLIFDPLRLAWSAPSEQRPRCGGAMWANWGDFVVLPDGRVLSIACTETGGIRAQFYNSRSDTWAYATEPEFPANIAGGNAPLLLLPDGRILAIGRQQVYYYSPSQTEGERGQWNEGPGFPPRDSRGWEFRRPTKIACLLPSGRVLCGAEYTTGERLSEPIEGVRYNLQEYFTVLFELDTGTNIFYAQENSRFRDQVVHLHGSREGHAEAQAGLCSVLLPTGQVLLSTWGGTFEVYTPETSPTYLEQWRPHVSLWPPEVRTGESFELRGRQFNGLSQANSNILYLVTGTSQNATNYPLVQIRRTGREVLGFCQTSSHSHMGVATGNMEVLTTFKVPGGLEAGSYELRVIANGIPSEWCQTLIPSGGREPFLDILRAVSSFQIIGAIPVDGGGIIIRPGGQVEPVPPWDPAVWQAIDKLLPGFKKRLEDFYRLLEQVKIESSELNHELENLKDEIINQFK